MNGTTVLYTPIQPTGVDLAAYYDPATLAPPAQGGNQLVFVNFVDVPGTVYDAQSGSTLWNVAAVRNSGTPVGATSFTANGVTVSDLASVAGPGVTGAPGSIRFTADPTGAALARLVFFAEALGTFGTGYLLPPVPAPTS